ncbi:MAG: HTTM domain-containing protein [Zavarzinella sp.]
MSSPITVGTLPQIPFGLGRFSWLSGTIAAERVAALRICVGLLLLVDLFGSYAQSLTFFFGDGGIGDRRIFDELFSNSTLNWSVLRCLPGTWGPHALFALQVGAAICLILGVYPRVAAVMAWVVAVSFLQSNPFVHNGGDRLKIALLFMLIFLPTNCCWALKRPFAAKDPMQQYHVPAWPVGLLLFQLVVVYFFTGVYKILGATWRDGSVMHYIVNDAQWAHFSPNYLPINSFGLKLLAWGTVFWELSFPIAILFRKTRTITFLIGAFFHIASFIHLEVGMFALYALAYYLVLLPWEKFHKIRSYPSSRS